MTTANGTKSPSTSQPLLPQAAQSLVDSVDAFLFDCDGLLLPSLLLLLLSLSLSLSLPPPLSFRVIWKGDKLIEGVPHALRALRSLSLVDRNQDSQLTNIVSVCRQGKTLVFVTNNSTKSRKQYSRKFTSLGLDVSEVRVFL
ncbi:hypothetical protein BHE74_00018020 [Ensete ventricosum]|nr:hypothetical protein BHE74_00018020 [Ensete ventricosum]